MTNYDKYYIQTACKFTFVCKDHLLYLKKTTTTFEKLLNQISDVNESLNLGRRTIFVPYSATIMKKILFEMDLDNLGRSQTLYSRSKPKFLMELLRASNSFHTSDLTEKCIRLMLRNPIIEYLHLEKSLNLGRESDFISALIEKDVLNNLKKETIPDVSDDAPQVCFPKQEDPVQDFLDEWKRDFLTSFDKKFHNINL